MTKTLKIDDLQVQRDGAEVVRGVTIDLPAGQVHALMGPNGSGKSSLANALMSHPKYEITGGRIRLDGEDVTALPPNEKAKRGLFLSMQYPPEIPGVTASGFLRAALNQRREKPIGVIDFHKLLREKMAELRIEPSFAGRGLNEGFSGGERKRLEILQLEMLEPKYAILDETDSGLDVDALKIVTNGIARAKRRGAGILVITHYARMLEYLVPDRVYVLHRGKIARTGGKELAQEIEKSGYAFLDD